MDINTGVSLLGSIMNVAKKSHLFIHGNIHNPIQNHQTTRILYIHITLTLFVYIMYVCIYA